MTRLAVHDLAVARAGVPVLQGVSFALEPGRALVLRGPNGIGKTTLLRTIAGLQPPLQGRVEAAPDSITYAAHADGVKATLTVAENLTFWARVLAPMRWVPRSIGWRCANSPTGGLRTCQPGKSAALALQGFWSADGRFG